MKFPYLRLATFKPVLSLGGSQVRHRPIFSVRMFGPQGSRLRDCSLDCGSDDTSFPEILAKQLGIDLSNASKGHAKPIAGQPVSYQYADVDLEVSDGYETCKWNAIVGFVDLPLRWPILGQAGFLQFFDAELLGFQHEVLLKSNASFPGQHLFHD